MTTYTNKKTQETVESSLSNQDAWEKCLQNGGDWLLYWVHKIANQATENFKRSYAEIFGLFEATKNSLKRPQMFIRWSIDLDAKWNEVQDALQEEHADCEVIAKQFACEVRNSSRVRIYKSSRSNNLCFKRNSYYQGCIQEKTGKFFTDKKIDKEMQSLLDRLEENPLDFLSKLGKISGVCQFCNHPLTDARSKSKGYGPICAKNWGLPWGDIRKDCEIKQAQEVLSTPIEDSEYRPMEMLPEDYYAM